MSELPAEVVEQFEIVERSDVDGLYLVRARSGFMQGELVELVLLSRDTFRGVSERNRRRKELEKLSAVTTPVIVAPLRVGETSDGGIWLVRERVAGETLEARIASGPLGVDETLKLFTALARALDELHRSGLLFRSLEAASVRLCENGPRLVGAGIAYPSSPALNGVAGPLSTLAPELADGNLASFRSDLYALGCLLIEALGGASVHSGTADEKLASIRRGVTLILPSIVPTPLKALAQQLVETDPSARPFSAMQVLKALESVAEDLHPRKSISAATSLDNEESDLVSSSETPLLADTSPAADELTDSAPIVAEASVIRSPRPALRFDSDVTQRVSLEELIAVEESHRATAASHLMVSDDDDAEDELDDDEVELMTAGDGTQRVSFDELRALEWADAGAVEQNSAGPSQARVSVPEVEIFREPIEASTRPARVPETNPRVALEPELPAQVGAELRNTLPPTEGEIRFPSEAPLARISNAPPRISHIPQGIPVAKRVYSQGAAFFAGGALLFLSVTAFITYQLWADARRSEAAVAALRPTAASAPRVEVPTEEATRVAAATNNAANNNAANNNAATNNAATNNAATNNAANNNAANNNAANNNAANNNAANNNAANRNANHVATPSEPSSRQAISEETDDEPSTLPSSATFDEAREAARAAFAAHRFEDAEEAYLQASAINPGHAGTWAGLGAARMNLENYRGAVHAYQRATQLSPRNAAFLSAMGHAQRMNGDISAARAAYERALTLDPENTAAQRGLAETE